MTTRFTARLAPLAAAVFTLNLTRGSASGPPENRVVIGPGSRWLIFLVDQPEARGSSQFQIRISTANGKSVGEAVDASPNGNGMLAAPYFSTLFVPGDYVVSVESEARRPQRPLASYRFRAVP